MDKEKRGIYNVSFNKKQSTPIDTKLKQELEAIDNAIINYMKEYVVHYVKGWHNTKRDKGRGAEHIKIHLEPNSEGQITLEELLNLGNSIREYLKVFKEPFDDGRGGKVYEWENNKGVRFRIATDKIKGEGLIPPLSPSDEIIITFYSDRNLNKQMEFKNPNVAEYYKDKTQQKIGDIGIRNDSGTNTIFHANISSNRNFERLAKKEQAVTGEAVHSLHTSRPAELGGNNQELSGANAHSVTTNSIIPQQNKSTNDFKTKLEEFNNKNNTNNKDLER
ncbi:hypothetical protein A0Y59_07620 [Campylobacter lari]|uniref:Uncharacterized protein n=1 Tax=Campylobacter lari TaxID=201 RepID=A0A7U8G2G1_CAMLA|nr:hypothetical protein [Campylobacter lari]